jgi:Ftsk gamma domain
LSSVRENVEMGFLRRLFGRVTPAPEPAVYSAQALLFEDEDAEHIAYGVDVVGESFYQPALDEIAGGRTTEGCVNREHVAALVPEPQNPYDKQAVAVLIEGRLVGHLSREDARAYAIVIRRCRDADRYPAAHATLTGGWDRGADDRGHIGVRLALGKPASMLAALAEKAGLPDYGGPGAGDDANRVDGDDRLFTDAVGVVQEYDRASASLLQRRLNVGYARAARLIDHLEQRGYIGPFDGSNSRKVNRKKG